MTILDRIVELLAMHGVDGRGYDRIDIALDKLYQVEKAEREVNKTVSAPKVEETRKKNRKEAPVTEEVHMGI